MKFKKVVLVWCLLVFLLLPGCQKKVQKENVTKLPPDNRQKQVVTWVDYKEYQEALKDRTDISEEQGVFSHDKSEYYYVENNVLYCKDTKTGDCEIVKNEYNMRVASVDGIHPDKDFLSVMIYPSAYDMDVCGAVLNPEDGQFLALDRRMLDPTYAGDNFYSIFYGNEREASGIYGGSLSENGTFKMIPIPELQMQDSPMVFLLNGSNYALVQYSDNEEVAELWKLGDTVQKCGLFELGLKGLVENPIYFPKKELIMGCVYNGNDYEAVLIDPVIAEFQDGRKAQILENNSLIDEAIIEAYYAEQNWECPEHLQKVQVQAERLEKEYDVEILLGSRCQKFIDNAVYETVICEDAECIQNGLKDLEKALNLYPDNFFSQFRDAVGNGGITFLLAQINAEPLGYADFQDGRYCITMDVSGCQNMSVYFTFCHEIWHSMESFIVEKSPGAFEEEKWNTLNPEGFKYYDTYEYEAMVNGGNEWILAFSNPGEAYFTDNYGKTNSYEDRARIMEEVMTGENVVEDFRKNPHLNQKLQVMADAVRQAFDTTGWDKPRWEEPLK